MATIIVDGFPCHEKTRHAEMLAAALGWRLTVVDFIADNVPFWETGKEKWDYKNDNVDSVVDGFILENWHRHGNIRDKREIQSIAAVQNCLYRRDDMLYHWCVTPTQTRSRSGIIERLTDKSGIAFSVLDEHGYIAEYCPVGTYKQKVKSRIIQFPVGEWWQWGGGRI